MSHRIRILASIALGLAALMHADDSSAQIVETPSGPLEFIGLRRWSAQTLWDSIYALSPREGAHACASTLTMHFGFADAMVMMLQRTTEGPLRWTAVVVEDSSLVRWSALPPASKADSASARVYNAVCSSTYVDQVVVASYVSLLLQGRDSARSRVGEFNEMLRQWSDKDTVGLEVERAWDLIYAQRSTADLARALETLRTDGNDTNRAAALLVLSNFADRDEAWLAAVAELRTAGDERRRMLASRVLGEFTSHFARWIDWRSEVETLRALLSGTSVNSIHTVIGALIETGLDTSLARPLLEHNTWLLAAFLSAEDPSMRLTVVDLLRALSGRPEPDLEAAFLAAGEGDAVRTDPDAPELLEWLKTFE